MLSAKMPIKDLLRKLLHFWTMRIEFDPHRKMPYEVIVRQPKGEIAYRAESFEKALKLFLVVHVHVSFNDLVFPEDFDASHYINQAENMTAKDIMDFLITSKQLNFSLNESGYFQLDFPLKGGGYKHTSADTFEELIKKVCEWLSIPTKNIDLAILDPLEYIDAYTIETYDDYEPNEEDFEVKGEG
jgi:hypothetical protein